MPLHRALRNHLFTLNLQHAYYSLTSDGGIPQATMETATLQTSSSLFLPPDSYIYRLRPVNAGPLIAAISSDDSLRLFDLETLAKQSTAAVGAHNALKDIHKGVTCLEAFGPQQEHCVLTAGRDGAVRGWDLRSGKKILELKDLHGSPYLSLGVGGSNHLLAAGTELIHAQATVEIWDYRSTKDSLRKYVDSHNDDVSELHFHPHHPSSLLSGSTDGLVNIYNTTIADEDDALVQITNHGSSIHHAGFLTDTQLYALSHDEVFSVYPLISQDDETAASDKDHAPTKFGDLRGLLNCEYIVDIITPSENGETIIAAGIHSDRSSLALVPLHLSGSNWCITPDRAVQLDGAHGSEIVRSICLPNHSLDVILTAGEDGLVKVWRMLSGDDKMDEEEEAEPASKSISKKKKRTKDNEGEEKEWKRFKPY